MGRAHGDFMPLPRTSLFSNFHVFTNKEALWILSFWVFVEASLQRHNWLSCGSLVIELSFQPHSPSRWWETKFQPSSLMAGSIDNQPPLSSAFQKPSIQQYNVINPKFPVVMERSLLRTTGDPFHLYDSEAVSGTEDKRSSIMTKDSLTAQEILKGMKTKYIFLIISHISVLFYLCARNPALVFLSLSFSEIGVWLHPCRSSLAWTPVPSLSRIPSPDAWPSWPPGHPSKSGCIFWLWCIMDVVSQACMEFYSWLKVLLTSPTCLRPLPFICCCWAHTNICGR